MGQVDSPAVAPETPRSAPMRNGPGEAPEAPKTERRPRGFFLQYKPGQGKGTRSGTILGVGVLVAWGAVFVNRYLAPYAEEFPKLNGDGLPVIEPTVEQKYLFDKDGWLLIPSVLSPEEIAEMREWCERLHFDPESIPEHERSMYSGPTQRLLDHPVAVGMLHEFTANPSPGADQPCGKLFEGQFQFRVRLVGSLSADEFHVIQIDLPDACGPLQ